VADADVEAVAEPDPVTREVSSGKVALTPALFPFAFSFQFLFKLGNVNIHIEKKNTTFKGEQQEKTTGQHHNYNETQF
jgi:hypothetical protein